MQWMIVSEGVSPFTPPLESLRGVFRLVARVLKPTGAVWLNVGDSYSRGPPDRALRKSLLLAPVPLALALMRDGCGGVTGHSL